MNKRLPAGKQATTYDMQAVRSAHEIDAGSRPEFCHQPRYGSQQYSDAFVDWIIREYGKDNAFFSHARERYYDKTHQ